MRMNLYEHQSTVNPNILVPYKELLPIEEAIRKAVDECIKEGILREFLIKNKSEAIQMSIFEYDEELHKQTLLEEGYEKGLERGLEQGLEQGLECGRREGMTEGKVRDILELLEDFGKVPEDIRQKILSERDLETLTKWLKTAAKTESIEQFLANM